MTSQLARDLAAIAHQHYVTPDTLDQGLGEGLVERMQEKLKESAGYEAAENECISILLDGIRDEGGVTPRETLESLIRVAFKGGFTAALGRKAVET